ncbi:MAG: fatty acid desaturase, partial [Bdellovibrionia bacterium]
VQVGRGRCGADSQPRADAECDKRSGTGEDDVRALKRLIWFSRTAQVAGRLLLHFAAGPFSWVGGVLSLAFHLALDSQFMHAIMHGAYVGLPGAEKYIPSRFETLAVPLQTKTWGLAHAVHHKKPSLVGEDPDAIHPLYRVHEKQPWRPLHIFNTFLAPMFVFELCVFDYDSELKKLGLRKPGDRSELKKFAKFFAYQYVLFPLLAGPNWKLVLAGNFTAVILRNFVVTGLQMASSVGEVVSTAHAETKPAKSKFEQIKFQVETSKNYVSSTFWRPFMGGLDRHIEHHLYPNLPPSRLRDHTSEIQELCRTHGVNYIEYGSFTKSVVDSLSYLQRLSHKTV